MTSRGRLVPLADLCAFFQACNLETSMRSKRQLVIPLTSVKQKTSQQLSFNQEFLTDFSKPQTLGSLNPCYLD